MIVSYYIVIRSRNTTTYFRVRAYILDFGLSYVPINNGDDVVLTSFWKKEYNLLMKIH